jgi:polyribonucleotide nucleotidyltransferase
MKFNQNTTTVSIGGRDISFETGKVARQAGGSVIVRSGDTILLATACSAPSTSENQDLRGVY